MSEARHYADEPGFSDAVRQRFDAQVSAVIQLSARLCAEPGVTVPAHRADLAAVSRTLELAAERAAALGLGVRVVPADADHPVPLLLAWAPRADPRSPAVREAVLLVGHLDVVGADPTQWRPFLLGDELHARGATDMKTVCATWIEWLGARGSLPGGPALVLVLSGCEENGSAAPWSASDALDWLERDCGCRVRFAIVGERTGELEWMKPPPIVGPVCRENRSWRWIRFDGPGGEAGLRAVAVAVKAGRERVVALNRGAVPAEKAARQPGLRSGFLCSFAQVSGEGAPPGSEVLIVEKRAGASMHAAAADASAPTAVEVLADALGVVRREAGSMAATAGFLALSVGEEGNFNSTDGSGRLYVAWRGAPLVEALPALSAALPGLALRAGAHAELPAGPEGSAFGLDIRELLDHQDDVTALIAGLSGGELAGFRLVPVNARPAWRCAEEEPDLVALLAAWEQVVGAPSPDLVKLHGNDGGLLAARSATPGHAPAVVFGQVGARPHGPDELHQCRSVRPYWDILDAWADRVWGSRG